MISTHGWIFHDINVLNPIWSEIASITLRWRSIMKSHIKSWFNKFEGRKGYWRSRQNLAGNVSMWNKIGPETKSVRFQNFHICAYQYPEGNEQHTEPNTCHSCWRTTQSIPITDNCMRMTKTATTPTASSNWHCKMINVNLLH